MDSTIATSSNITDKYTIITDSGDTSENYLINETVQHTLNFQKGSTLSIYLVSTINQNTLEITDMSNNLLNIGDTSGNSRADINLAGLTSITIKFTSGAYVPLSGYIIVLKLATIRFAFNIGINIAADYPFTNSGSFSSLSQTNVSNGDGTYKVAIEYTDTDITNTALATEGISFYGKSYANELSIDITEIDGALLTNLGSQFELFAGSIVSFGSPIIRSNASNMFLNSTSTDLNVSTWNVGLVTDMSNMFSGATAFNADIGNWNVALVSDMNNMFSGATTFNVDISSWNVVNVSDMNNMFNNATTFNADIGNWNVANVINMNNMFNFATSFNQTISNWNVANVTDMSNMFYGARSFNQNIGTWDFTKLINSNITSILEGSNLHYTTYSSFIQDLSSNTTIVTNQLFNNQQLGFYRTDDSVTNDAYTYLSGIGIGIIDAGSLTGTELEIMFNTDFTK